MTLISIRERSGPGDANATVSFDGQGEYPVVVGLPFSDEEEARLEWYFEQHLRFPFTEQVRARAAAASVAQYGERLFKQIFRDNPEVYGEYKAALQAGVGGMVFEIAGPPEFQRLHWEALKDPNLPRAFALEAPMLRKNLVPQAVKATLRPSPTINLLVVVARPGGGRDVGYRTISRPLVEALRQAGPPIQIEILRPGSYQALVEHLEATRDAQGAGHYHVIHFDLHGAVLEYQQIRQGMQAERYTYQARYGRADLKHYTGRKAFLFFEGAGDERSDPVEAGELADLLIAHQLPIAILNACQSGKQIGASETSLGSRLMQAGVQLVLAMGYSVTVTAAELLMRTLYTQLFGGADLAAAIRRARLELYNRKERRAYYDQTIDLEDWLLPVVYQNQPQHLATREFTPDESKAHYERQAAAYPEPATAYGFVGRDLDILNIERRLLAGGQAGRPLLVRGMGGAGKTTLLRYLGWWWQTTRLVDQVFYFGYDERAWTRQQIMDAIARQLLTPVEYVGAFQPLSLDAQQAMLAGRLRAKRQLLILDNLESITGAQLAIQNTLPPEEQAALRGLLVALAGGKTLVLLGSRGGEEWLIAGLPSPAATGMHAALPSPAAAGEGPGVRAYELPGLDPEAASTLAERILEQHGVAKYRADDDFRKLLRLLDGYPLALEVVLANLARQTPAEVLAALQAGDEAIDMRSEKKTESILRCIEYSYSNLSPLAQGLLACLAPFTSVINIGALEQYTEQLRQQPALAQLPFERWQEVLQEAANWGLVSPHDVPGYLRLQPIMPYFLRSRLSAPGQGEVRAAIEMAFRQYYDGLGGMLRNLLQSKEAREKQVGQLLASLEYENLATALDLALEGQVSILNPYHTLSLYLDATQDQRRGLELGETVLKRLEQYSADKLAGPLGAEFVGVIDDIAMRQLLLKQHAAAEASYQSALHTLSQQTLLDAKISAKVKAGILHQLGYVAQEQRQWAQAEQHYQQALAIKIEYNDRYAQARTYHQLGRVAQEQRQWAQARDHFLRALETYAAYEDSHNGDISLRSLARLWRASGDAGLPAAVAGALGITPEEAEARLRAAGGTAEGAE